MGAAQPGMCWTTTRTRRRSEGGGIAMVFVLFVVLGAAFLAAVVLLALAAFGVWRPARESPARSIGAVSTAEGACTVPRLTVVGGVEAAERESSSEELRRRDPAA